MIITEKFVLTAFFSDAFVGWFHHVTFRTALICCKCLSFYFIFCLFVCLYSSLDRFYFDFVYVWLCFLNLFFFFIWSNIDILCVDKRPSSHNVQRSKISSFLFFFCFKSYKNVPMFSRIHFKQKLREMNKYSKQWDKQMNQKKTKKKKYSNKQRQQYDLVNH